MQHKIVFKHYRGHFFACSHLRFREWIGLVSSTLSCFIHRWEWNHQTTGEKSTVLSLGLSKPCCLCQWWVDDEIGATGSEKRDESLSIRFANYMAHRRLQKRSNIMVGLSERPWLSTYYGWCRISCRLNQHVLPNRSETKHADKSRSNNRH